MFTGGAGKQRTIESFYDEMMSRFPRIKSVSGSEKKEFQAYLDSQLNKKLIALQKIQDETIRSFTPFHELLQDPEINMLLLEMDQLKQAFSSYKQASFKPDFFMYERQDEKLLFAEKKIVRVPIDYVLTYYKVNVLTQPQNRVLSVIDKRLALHYWSQIFNDFSKNELHKYIDTKYKEKVPKLLKHYDYLSTDLETFELGISWGEMKTEERTTNFKERVEYEGETSIGYGARVFKSSGAKKIDSPTFSARGGDQGVNPTYKTRTEVITSKTCDKTLHFKGRAYYLKKGFDTKTFHPKVREQLENFDTQIERIEKIASKPYSISFDPSLGSLDLASSLMENYFR